VGLQNAKSEEIFRRDSVITMKKRVANRDSKFAIFWADPKSDLIVNCNKAAETLLERKKRDIIGSSLRTLYPQKKATYYTYDVPPGYVQL
jgi:hypothetical protein